LGQLSDSINSSSSLAIEFCSSRLLAFNIPRPDILSQFVGDVKLCSKKNELAGILTGFKFAATGHAATANDPRTGRDGATSMTDGMS